MELQARAVCTRPALAPSKAGRSEPGASSLPGPGLSQGQGSDWGGGGVDSFSKSQSSISPSALPSPCPLSLQLSFLLPPFLHFSYDFLFLPLAPSSPPFLHLSFPFFSFSQFSSIPTPPAFFTLEACGSIHYTSIMCNNFCFLDETHKMNKRHLCLPR